MRLLTSNSFNFSLNLPKQCVKRINDTLSGFSRIVNIYSVAIERIIWQKFVTPSRRTTAEKNRPASSLPCGWAAPPSAAFRRNRKSRRRGTR